MKQIVKRILTFALSAAMVLTLVPTTAFAEDTGSNNVNKNLRVSGTSEGSKTQNVSEREQLKKLIEKADKLNEGDYTAESWAEFKDVRESIEDVDEIPDQYVGIVLPTY